MGISALLSYGLFYSEGWGDRRDWIHEIKHSLVMALLPGINSVLTHIVNVCIPAFCMLE